jgi:hypothetical protein
MESHPFSNRCREFVAGLQNLPAAVAGTADAQVGWPGVALRICVPCQVC